MKKNPKGRAEKPAKSGVDSPPRDPSKESDPLDSSGEYKGGTQTGSTEGRLNRDLSQEEKERVQEGGSDRK